MSDYINRSLSPGEQVVKRGAWPIVYWLGAFAILIGLGWLFGIGVVWFAVLAVKMVTTDWAVTNDRIVVKRGWLSLNTQELAVDRVESVQVMQSFWGRLFGYGQLVITGTGDTSIRTPPTAQPVEFRRAIEIARDMPNSGAKGGN